MVKAKQDSRSHSARRRAREALAAERERVQTREESLVAVFAALQAREEADLKVGQTLAALRELGESNSAIAELTGLRPREVSTLVGAASQGSPNESAQSTDSEAIENDHPDHSDSALVH